MHVMLYLASELSDLFPDALDDKGTNRMHGRVPR